MMKSTDSLRIGDAERDAAIAVLARHFADGRLTQAEHDERTSLALNAKTGADLRALFTDLPMLHDPPPLPEIGFVARAVQPLIVALAIGIAMIMAAGVLVTTHVMPVLFVIAVAFAAVRLSVCGRRRHRPRLEQRFDRLWQPDRPWAPDGSWQAHKSWEADKSWQEACGRRRDAYHSHW